MTDKAGSPVTENAKTHTPEVGLTSEKPASVGTPKPPTSAEMPTCPECGATLQRMPKVGCHVGPDCTHGCPGCGMHYTLTEDDDE